MFRWLLRRLETRGGRALPTVHTVSNSLIYVRRASNSPPFRLGMGFRSGLGLGLGFKELSAH